MNLWGYAPRREEALRDLHHNFAYLFQEIDEEDEGRLDVVARRLRARLVRLVANPEETATHA